jgi:HPt (histidine-containing phosphotransfer) domain-containing protein
MDDYLSKPVEPRELHAVIERWGRFCKQDEPPQGDARCGKLERQPREGAASGPLLPTDPRFETEVFDLSALRARVEDDLELLAEMIDLYLSSSPLLLQEIESAVAARDRERINRTAHTLKGLLKNMCATTCAEAALQLEAIGKTGDLTQADELLAALKHEFERLQTVLIDTGKGAVYESSCC